jgi:hypothetical protein
MKKLVLVKVLAVTLVMLGTSLSARAVTLSSGATATAFGPDWIYDEGANGFGVIDADASGVVRFLVDLGSEKEVNLFKMFSVPYAADWNIKNLKIFVAPDEASMIANDTVGYVDSYTQQVFSGTVFDWIAIPANTQATVDITNSSKQFFMFEASVPSGYGKVYSGDIQLTLPPTTTFQAFAPDWIYNEGSNGFAVINEDPSKTTVRFRVDLGLTTNVALFNMFTVPYTTGWNIKDLEIFVAPDETSSSFVCDDPACYTTQVFSGTLFNGEMPGNTLGIADITDTTKRYFMFKVLSTSYGNLSEFKKAYSGAIQAMMPTSLTFSPDGGNLYDVQNVVITCVTSNAVIRYTTDGSAPSANHGTQITSGGTILVDHPMTLKALAWVNGEPGLIKSATYNYVTKTPTFSGSQYVTGPKAVTISCATLNATIYYTTDGGDPATVGIQYTGPVTVCNGGQQATTLKAIAQVPGFEVSSVKSLAYTIPASYNRPEVIAQTTAPITIDGNFSDWADANWASLNQSYHGNGATDVTSAYYAAKWGDNGNKVYVAVKVKDDAYSFADDYDVWNARDAIEIYLHTTNTNNPAYSSCTTAQQYAVGIKNSNHNQVWTSLRDTKTMPANAGFQAAGRASADGWIYYEVAVTPFEFFGGLLSPAQPNVSNTLAVGDVIGLDVCVVGHNGTAGDLGYTGMKAENMLQWKSEDYNKFGLHKLVAAPALRPGDANGDGMVDVGDLGILAANYGGTNKSWAQGDFNGDKLVDVGDLGILAAHYGEGSTQQSNFEADYASAFGTTVADDQTQTTDNNSSICGALGLPLVAGLMLAGLMLLGSSKLED